MSSKRRCVSQHKLKEQQTTTTKIPSADCTSHPPESTGGVFNLPCAPVFYPKEEEFADPWKYLRSIRDRIVETGICVIQPPAQNWDFHSFEKCVNPKTFTFETKAQNVHQMQNRKGPTVHFLDEVNRFWMSKGERLYTLPEINGDPVDLSMLDSEVERRGGLEKVNENHEWAEILQILRISTVSKKPRKSSRLPSKKAAKVTSKKESARNLKKGKSTASEVEIEDLTEELSDHLRDLYSQYIRPFRESSFSEKNEDVEMTEIKEETDKEVKKRGKEKDEDSRPAKRRKKNPVAEEPRWKQVKARSFVEDSSRMYMSSTEDSSEPSQTSDNEDEECCKDYTEFGYTKGKKFTLEKFRDFSTNFEERWKDCVTPDDKERAYWKIVEDGASWINVQYGSDLDVLAHGSGFPLNKDSNNIYVRQRARTIETQNRTKRKPSNSATGLGSSSDSRSSYMSKSGWNTNNLASSTFLHHLKEDVGGVTRPMMYVGMLFSSFCWHTEDNYLYSINYLHTGKPKLWYGVPGSAADQFEAAMRAHLPQLFDKNPNLLHLLITQLSPSVLLKAGVPVYTALQNSGQFVVTCPRSYHAGFNTGFNCAESVNFALEDWLPFGRQACEDYRSMRSSVFPHEEFILKAVKNPDSVFVTTLLLDEIKKMITTEEELQENVRNFGITNFEHVAQEKTHLSSSRKKGGNMGYHSCEECGFDCFLSYLVCQDHPDKVSCLKHIAKGCECPAEKKKIQVRYPISELKLILASLESKAQEQEKKGL